MKQPVTELDTRFSDQDAIATDWEETRRVLERAELFWISTVRADGRPHVTPLVAVWLDNAIHFATGPREQKAVNLRANQNVILTTGCNQWEQGLDVVVEGEAVQVTDESVLERLAETWATKWDGHWHYEVHDGGFRHEGGTLPMDVLRLVATLARWAECMKLTLRPMLLLTASSGGTHRRPERRVGGRARSESARAGRSPSTVGAARVRP